MTNYFDLLFQITTPSYHFYPILTKLGTLASHVCVNAQKAVEHNFRNFHFNSFVISKKIKLELSQ